MDCAEFAGPDKISNFPKMTSQGRSAVVHSAAHSHTTNNKQQSSDDADEEAVCVASATTEAARL